MAWVTDNEGNLTEDSGKKILLYEDLELVKKLILRDELQFKQNDSSFITLRASKDQGYDFGIWNSSVNKYRLFINHEGRVGVGTNAPYALLTAIQDTVTDTQFAAAFVNVSDSGKGLSVIAGNTSVPNTVFTNKNGVDIAWVMGDGDIKSINHFSAVSQSTNVGVEKFRLSNGQSSRISLLNINNETGSNNEGNDFLIRTYDDVGDKLHDTIFIKRSTGYIGVGNTNPLYNLDVTGDVNIDGVLYINGVPADFAGTPTLNLEDIQDVIITNLQSDEVLTWNGSNWVNTVSKAISNGGFNYRGLWNASNNTPSLNPSTFIDGDVYVVAVAGTTNLNGIEDWKVGEMVYRQAGNWVKLPVAPESIITSVAGRTGDITLTTEDLVETTNLFYTDTRSRAAISSASAGLSYNSITGVLSLEDGYILPTQTQINSLARFVHSGTFASGILDFMFNDGTEAFTIDLDGRYALESHTHNYDNYDRWRLQVGAVIKAISSDNVLKLVTDGTMTSDLNPVTNTLQLTGSMVSDVKFRNNILNFTSVGAAFDGNIDLNPLIAYKPARYTPTINSVGGIPAGTTYDVLAGNPLGVILDKILYGDNSGATYTVPELTIIFTKDGSSVGAIPPGTVLDNSYVYTVNISTGSYSNDVGTVQGPYIPGTIGYTCNLYVNGTLKETKTIQPTTDVTFDLTGTVISASTIIETEVVIPSRDVTVIMSDTSTITLTLPSQTVKGSSLVEATPLSYHLSVHEESDLPTTGTELKAVAIGERIITTFAKSLIDKAYMLAVPAGTKIAVHDSGSVQIDYIQNEYFIKSSSITSIPDASGTLVDYDVYTLINAVPYSNTSNFNITII